MCHEFDRRNLHNSDGKIRIVLWDLKPENVMLVPDPDTASGERAKIVDFGIAKLDGDDGRRQTTRGVALGTPTYMAPEQIESKQQPTDRLDVYAFGIVLFELLSGAPVKHHQRRAAPTSGSRAAPASGQRSRRPSGAGGQDADEGTN